MANQSPVTGLCQPARKECVAVRNIWCAGVWLGAAQYQRHVYDDPLWLAPVSFSYGDRMGTATHASISAKTGRAVDGLTTQRFAEWLGVFDEVGVQG